MVLAKICEAIKILGAAVSITVEDELNNLFVEYGDNRVIGSDITYLVGSFRGINPNPNPLLSGDANGDCLLIGSDVTYLVNYFRGIGQAPVRGCCE